MLRNKELRRYVFIHLTLSAVFIFVGFYISAATGILIIAISAIFGMAFFIFTAARYRNLARISNMINRVLHNDNHIDFGEIDEGELSILHSEIMKMTLRIKEQNDTLKKDKQYLSDSLADIAHQLRTPLTSANLILSFLAKNHDEQETFENVCGTEQHFRNEAEITKRQDFIREMEALLVRMDWLITSLLKISRIDAGVVDFQKNPVKVQKLIQSAFNPLAIAMELRNIDLKNDVPDNAEIQGDFGWLTEAVQNILKNCMESICENSNIYIDCEVNTLYTEITIHDNGKGFNKDDLPRLFDRFYRGNSVNATGYGIGLALSKMIITRNNGYITAKNHPEGGALFTLRFPKGAA